MKEWASCLLSYSKDLVPFENCKVVFIYEIFEIEKPGSQLNINRLQDKETGIEKRKMQIFSLYFCN